MKSYVAGVLTALAFSIGVFGESPLPVYDPDPDHPWNRLYGILYLRALVPEQEVRVELLDPVLWANTKYLLTQPTHGEAVAFLDDFFAKNSDGLIREPVHRAMLQHDLWTVFDWVQGSNSAAPYQSERKALKERLVAIMRRLALSKAEIDALPNLIEAELDSARPDNSVAGNTPADRVVVRVGTGEMPAARQHTIEFGARSVFTVFLLMPKPQADNYLETLTTFLTDHKGQDPGNSIFHGNAPGLPVAPDGRETVLVRRMLLIDKEGEICVSPLIESVQSALFVPRDRENRRNDTSHSETRFTRSGSGVNMLQASDNHAIEFSTLYQTTGFDPIENQRQNQGSASYGRATLRHCLECHGGSPSSQHVFLTFARQSFESQADGAAEYQPRTFSAGSERDEAASAVAYKKTLVSWKELTAMWKTE